MSGDYVRYFTLTRMCRSVNYDHNMFIIQATGVFVPAKQHQSNIHMQGWETMFRVTPIVGSPQVSSILSCKC
jgi:hypothetical protein